MKGWKVERKVRSFKGFCHFPCFQTLPPSRAPLARGEARGEARDDDDDADDDVADIYIMVKCVCFSCF